MITKESTPKKYISVPSSIPGVEVSEDPVNIQESSDGNNLQNQKDIFSDETLLCC